MLAVDPGGLAVYDVCMRPLYGRDYGFEFRERHRFSPRVFVVVCAVGGLCSVLVFGLVQSGCLCQIVYGSRNFNNEATLARVPILRRKKKCVF
jgi:hypothetical protein